MNSKPKYMIWPARLNQSWVFHPSRWPHAEWVGRCTALVIIAVFLGFKLYHFERFPQTYAAARHFYGALRAASGVPLYGAAQIAWLWGIKAAVWSVEVLIYIGYVLAYLTRARAVAAAEGFKETAFPVIVAGLPLLIAVAPFNLPLWLPYASRWHMPFFLMIMGLIVAGGLINVIGLLTLRRSFTIMTEARGLVTGGIFRLVRHPLYLGHFIMFAGSLFLRMHVYTVALYFLFWIGQTYRAANEERKLARAFPQYEAYRRATGMFFPKHPFPASRITGHPKHN